MELLELLETQLGLDMVQALLQLLLEEPGMGTPEELAKELWGR